MTEFQLPKLDFAPDALAPAMSAETIEYHYGKHHASYVANLNALLKGSAFEGKSLEEIICGAEGGLFNNAGGVPASNVAQWNGNQWSPLATGVTGTGLPPAMLTAAASPIS